MGFLEHDTNNIIIDAVLTDVGRQKLASGLGNFTITKFAVADDEVDYTLIEKFGRTVGRDKIEKNTPIFEASTLGKLGLKYLNPSFNNNFLSRLPTLVLNNTLQGGVVSLTRSSTAANSDRSVLISLTQQILGGFEVDPDVTNYSYQVTMDHRFLRISRAIPDSVDSSNIATYTIRCASPLTTQKTSNVSFRLAPNIIADTTFNEYAHTSGGSSIVSRVVTVKGLNDGQVNSFTVNIT